VRARRSLASRALSEDPDFAAILALAERGAWENAPARLRGYGRVVVAVRDAALRRAHRGILTAAEREVLHALAEGMNAPAIALETGRSVHTIRSHTSAIISKLGAHGRGDAVARARKLGLIEP
jgi:DNA-binding NarL/FixJ family response regulator